MLKVGDKVRVRRYKDLCNEFQINRYNGNSFEYVDDGFVPLMRGLCGQVFTVQKVYSNGCCDLEGNAWAWKTRWLEEVT